MPRDYELQASDLPDADILIGTWWETAYDVARMPPEKGRKVYFVQGHEIHDHLPKERSAQTYRLPLKKITVSQWLVDVMAKAYGDTNVSKVLNAVDGEMFNAPMRQRQTRPTLGMMYAAEPFKGVSVALEAVTRLREAYPDLRLLAFGKTDPSPDMPLPGFAEFHRAPAQSDIAKLYASCDVWVMPSFTEGYGLPIIEAMACRTPVVSTNVGAARDLITPGQNGFITEPGDSAAMADRLADILALTDEDWQRFSEAAHARAHGYNWLDASRQFEQVLQGLMAEPAATEIVP
ncbi:MAG: glycosyltransferase family 4 protein [Pseudomonadota bacterium]